MWVACCVTTPAACVSVRSERPGITGPWGHGAVDAVEPVAPPGRASGRWGRRSVHRLAKMASRRRFGAFVYTVATRGSRERPWGAQECTQIGENGLSTPFWGICVHCCDAGVARADGGGRRSVHRLAKMASRRRFGAFVYTVATPGCVGWRERRRREVSVFIEASTHTNLEGSESNQRFFVGEER